MLLIGLISELPLFITAGLIMLYAIHALTPNPKKYALLNGWLMAEFLEHIILPIVFISAVMIFPLSRFVLVGIIIAVVYGKVIGDAKTDNDWLKIIGLYIIFILLIYLPSISVIWIYSWDYPGFMFYLITNILAFNIYMIWRVRRKDEKKYMD